jgi:hypothetical protein
MRIFHYREGDGLFVAEGVADADPLVPDNWLIPAHATSVAPGPEVDGFTRNFNPVANAWQYVEVPAPTDETEATVP